MLLFVILKACRPNIYFAHNLNDSVTGEAQELFAPLLVNTDPIEINSVFNSTYTELFYTRIIDGSFIIHHSEVKDGNWPKPKPIQLFTDQNSESVAIDPSITIDGNTMYFLGISPEGRSKNSKPDIYKSQKINENENQ